MTTPRHIEFSVSTPDQSRNAYFRALFFFFFFLLVVAVVLLVRNLPLATYMQQIQAEILLLGFWGPLVFILIYILAVVLMLPAWWLTVAAGALFGPVAGMLVASVSSTVGAALAFLIARYLARQRLTRWYQNHPHLAAVDSAVTHGGWKIVALLRLSPAVPFNLQNYLYGITGISFWTCVLTSWVAMVPVTFLYIYLGHMGRIGLESTSSARATRTPWEWSLLGIGFVATIVVTIYISRLARIEMHKQAVESNQQPTPTNCSIS